MQEFELNTESLLPHETHAFMIFQLARRMKFIAKEFLEQELSGLKVDEYAILEILDSNPGVCQKDLVELCAIEKGRVCKTISLLEEKELVKRFPGVKNKKLIYVLEITEKGKKCLTENNKHVVALKQMFLESFTVAEADDLCLKLKRLLLSVENYVNQKTKEKKCPVN